LVNEQASGLVDENGTLLTPQENSIVLGIEDEVLFGKTFKIRITSKDTGKKLDLNIAFKTSVVKAPTESLATGYVPPAVEGVVVQGTPTAAQGTPTAPPSGPTIVVSIPTTGGY
jgi:hypothetical protein